MNSETDACHELCGLYLHVEKGFTGREVQHAHMKLAQAIDAWCASVWSAYREYRNAVVDLLREYGIAQ